MKRLKISANHRFLMFDDGSPFFWLGDTAWELFHRLTFEEAGLYLENRRQKGFTVIQAVVLAEFDGLNTPNPYGECPLIGHDPLRPNERYFDYIDRVIRLAGEKGLFVGLLPTWGDKVELLAHGKGPVIFNPENARRYGEWIGRRYRDFENVVWINGGDRSGGGANTAIWNALGSAIKSVDPNHLMTFHPLGGGGGHSSSEWFHQADWLDFNLAQSGHECRDLPNHEIVARDYALQPTKPCLDGEPRYEDHAVNWKPAELGYFDDSDARQAAYWAVFAGACGHTYGCHPIWQFLAPGRDPIGFARRPWREALDLPGAYQMGHLRRFIESRPLLSRVPDQSLVVDTKAGGEHIRATRGDGYAFIYLPRGGEVVVRPGSAGVLAGETTPPSTHRQDAGAPRLRASWFDPRQGTASEIGVVNRASELRLTAPSSGRAQDWVLVLDDLAASFPPPGLSSRQ
jgi:hypothetical protein